MRQTNNPLPQVIMTHLFLQCILLFTSGEQNKGIYRILYGIMINIDNIIISMHGIIIVIFICFDFT